MVNLPEENVILAMHIQFLFSLPCQEFSFDVECKNSKQENL